MADTKQIPCDGQFHLVGTYSAVGVGTGNDEGDASDRANRDALDKIEDKLPTVACECGGFPVMSWTLVRDREIENGGRIVNTPNWNRVDWIVRREQTYKIEAVCRPRRAKGAAKG